MLFISCPEQIQSDTGTLLLQFNNQLPRMTTLFPEIDMNPTSYDIVGDGPGGRSFEETSTGEPVEIENLFIGEWTIKVTAKNEDGIAIGYGEKTVTVKPAETVNSEIWIRLIGGLGNFILTVTWDDNLVSDAQMTGVMTASWDEELVYELDFVKDATAPLAIAEQELENGFYSLEFAFYDGNPETEEPLKHTVCAAWIVAGTDTIATFELTGTDLGLLGNLRITIVEAIQRPFIVDLTVDQTKIQPGSAVTVSSTVYPELDNLTYLWYFDGTFLDNEHGTGLILENLVDEGWHTIDMLVTNGYIMSSDSIDFQVKDFVLFEDPNLECVIREILGQPDGDIMRSDCLNIFDIKAMGKGIESLKGIQALENLKSLNFALDAHDNPDDETDWTYNYISDLSPLEGLIKLEHLTLKGNQIIDVSPLETLTELITLNLNINFIEDISPLANCTQLVDLRFNNNLVDDISSLSSLANLECLWAGLQWFDQEDETTGLQDISVISTFTNLTNLCLGGNRYISDFSAIADLANLEILELWSARMDSEELGVLEHLLNLQNVFLLDNLIDDITPLVNNTGIGDGDEINLSWNNLDLTPGSDDMLQIAVLENRGVTVILEELE
jgi:hypothetical protein